MKTLFRYINPLTVFAFISALYSIYLLVYPQHDEYGLRSLLKFSLLFSSMLSALLNFALNNRVQKNIVKIIVQFISIPIILTVSVIVALLMLQLATTHIDANPHVIQSQTPHP
jgi:hypothetical protein